jgi:lipoprotein signal peptidase
VDAVPAQGTGPGTDEPEETDADAPVAESPPARHLVLVLAVAAVTLAIDQLTKWWALETLSTRPPIELVGSLQFNLAFNEGAAFSFGDGLNLGPFIAVLAIFVVAFLVRSEATTNRLGAATAGLIAVNIADSAICVGAVLFVLVGLRKPADTT